AAEFGRSAGKEFRLRGHLGMDFHANDDLPITGGAMDELRPVGRPDRLVHSPSRFRAAIVRRSYSTFQSMSAFHMVRTSVSSRPEARASAATLSSTSSTRWRTKASPGSC